VIGFVRAFCALGRLVFAIVAWARRERYWALPLVSLLLGLALVGLFCYLGGGIDKKG
jgi:Na+/H+-translocating membrane pyrophosphatase